MFSEKVKVCRFKTYCVIDLNDETFHMQSSSSTQDMYQLIGLLIQVNLMVICCFVGNKLDDKAAHLLAPGIAVR